MVVIFLFKISLANYFIYSVCAFFVFAWVVIFTDIFVPSDKKQGTQTGQADLLKKNEGDISEEDQQAIDDKLATIGKTTNQEFLDSRIAQNFPKPQEIKPVDTQFDRTSTEKAENTSVDSSIENVTPETSGSISTTTNTVENRPAVNVQNFLEDGDAVPVSAVDDEEFGNFKEGSPTAFSAYNDDGLGVMDDAFEESIIFVKPDYDRQIICNADQREELNSFLAEFEQADPETQSFIRSEGMKVFEKIKMQQRQEHQKLTLDTGSMMYRMETNFEKIALSNFISQEELFNMNTLDLINLELDADFIKNGVIQQFSPKKSFSMVA